MDAKKTLEKYLKDAGTSVRETPERYKVLKAIQLMRDHFDINELYINMINSKDVVSRATIYNSIKLFVELGLVTETKIEGVIKSLYSNGAPDHYHIIRNHSEIIDFYSEEIDNVIRKVCKDNKIDANHFSVSIYS